MINIVTLLTKNEKEKIETSLPQDEKEEISTDNIVAAKIIITLVILVGLLSIIVISFYYWHKKRTRKPYHQYSQINRDPLEAHIKVKPKLKLTLPSDQPHLNLRNSKHVQFNAIGTFQKEDDEEFVIPPRTPETPATPNTPYLSEEHSMYPFHRSISAPSEKVSISKDQESDLLWRSTIKKSAEKQFLNTKPKADRKVSHCANGKIKLSLRYNQHGQKELNVQILDFVDLPLYRETGISNPYVKVYLYPQTAHSYPLNESKNGFRVEVLSFPVDNDCSFSDCPIDKLCSSALKFVILDYDRFSRSEFVADCVILLDEVSLEGESITKHLSIRKTHPEKDIGSLLVSLCYQPSTSRMSIIVLKASGLPVTENGHTPDHFVKISLMRCSNILDKRRTRVIKKSVCPVFNERLVFPVDTNSMRSLVLIFDVIKYDSKIKQEKIGTVILGNHSIQRQVTPHEIQHFNEILQSPQRQLAEWHQLIL